MFIKLLARKALLPLLVLMVLNQAPIAHGQVSDPGIIAQSAPQMHTAMVNLGGQSTPTEVTYEVAGSYATIEGDIILGEVDANGELIQPVEAAGIGTNGEALLQGEYWPNGVIPYTFSSHPVFKDQPNGMPSSQKQIVLDAIQHWRDKTDIEFVPRTTESDYIEFGVDTSPNGLDCASPIGRKGGKQVVIAGSCDVGTLIHELGHTVGLEHEHTRLDRNLYVTYFMANVDPPSKQSNFVQHQFSDGIHSVGPYDYGSIMHYGCTAWGKEDLSVFPPDKLVTLAPKNPIVGCAEGDGKAIYMGQRKSLSAGDIATVNSMYSFYTMGWNPSFCGGNQICTIADIDGNTKDDLVAFNRSEPGNPAGTVWVALTNDTGNGIKWSGVWNASFCGGKQICTTGDIDGNTKDDLIAFNRSEPGNPAGTVWVALTNDAGTGIKWSGVWNPSFCGGKQICTIGDMDGNHKEDLVAFNRSEPGNPVGTVWVALTNDAGTGIRWSGVWNPSFCAGTQICTTGDMNGDHKDDLVAFNRTDQNAPQGAVWVYVTNEAGTGVGWGGQWGEFFCANDQTCAVANIDGVGGDDIVAFSNHTALGLSQGDVYVAYSTGSSFGPKYRRHEYFCIGEETCETGDINGDGKDDIISFVRDTAPAPFIGAVWVGFSRAMPLPNGGVNEPAAAVAYQDAPLMVTTTCSDPQGWRHIHTLTYRLQTDAVDTEGEAEAGVNDVLWAEYDEEANQIRLYDLVTGEYQSGAPGEAKILQNEWVTLDLSKTTVGAADAEKKTVQIHWALTFSEEAKSQNFKQFLQVQDDAGTMSDLDEVGTLRVSQGTPTQLFLPNVAH